MLTLALGETDTDADMLVLGDAETLWLGDADTDVDMLALGDALTL